MALKIFAKKGTSEKAIVACLRKEVRSTLVDLNEKFGGEWIPVDELNAMSEILCFNDGLEYTGFGGNTEDGRYCKGIENLA